MAGERRADRGLDPEVALQRRYYTDIAEDYERDHVGIADEHQKSLDYTAFFIDWLGAESVLDVGMGTGRGARHFKAANPDLEVVGVDPVEGLVRIARREGLGPAEALVGSGYDLPFADNSFDVVFELGCLHHVRRPELIVREMIRVARKGIFMSDSNRFAGGPMGARYLKLALYRLGLWRAADWVKTGGRGYLYDEGDGVFYSYSLYDSYDMVRAWADEAFFIPIDDDRATRRLKTWMNPLLTSHRLLLCAFRR